MIYLFICQDILYFFYLRLSTPDSRGHLYSHPIMYPSQKKRKERTGRWNSFIFTLHGATHTHTQPSSSDHPVPQAGSTSRHPQGQGPSGVGKRGLHVVAFEPGTQQQLVVSPSPPIVGLHVMGAPNQQNAFIVHRSSFLLHFIRFQVPIQNADFDIIVVGISLTLPHSH